MPEERSWLDNIFKDDKYIDAFRELNKKENEYTWWSNRGNARENNVGWRIDYQIVSGNLKNKIKTVGGIFLFILFLHIIRIKT